MARRHRSIAATSVHSECMFSKSDQLISERPAAKNVQMVLFLNANMGRLWCLL